jgi:hypothetical protein
VYVERESVCVSGRVEDKKKEGGTRLRVRVELDEDGDVR